MKAINIAQTIMSKRKEKGITQDELAIYIGVSKASVSKWETGQSYPDITLLPQLATYFNITIDELMNYSPQMTNEEIKNLYHSLANDFSKEPFDSVYSKCKEIIKKYYSCFPLLMQMSILLINHYMLAKENEKQIEVLDEVNKLCERIKDESNEQYLIKQANAIQAIALLQQQKFSAVIDLLEEESKHMIPNNNIILVSAYMSVGDIKSATEALQSSIYNELLILINSMPLMLSLNINNKEKTDEIIKRSFGIAELFQLENIRPDVMLSLNLSVAQYFISQGDTDKALEYLNNYVKVCNSISFPITLHGDYFFDGMSERFSKLDLGESSIRSDEIVKGSIVEGVANNPMFNSIKDNREFELIVKKLKRFKGE